IPLAAVTAFADPQVRFGLRFQPEMVQAVPEPAADSAPAEATAPEAPAQPGQVLRLDAFRRRPARE
ncbi:ClpXP protease specificity-enhancing factor SspB, partial [Acinetobacter baumannii]